MIINKINLFYSKILLIFASSNKERINSVKIKIKKLSHEKDKDGLPLKTREGKNTFGCLVNGERFLSEFSDGRPPNPLSAEYDRKTNKLFVRCDVGVKYVGLDVDAPQENKWNSSTGIFFPYYNVPRLDSLLFTSENCNLFLTRFDTKNQIASGVFDFSGKREIDSVLLEGALIPYVPDTIVHITKGRFDVKFQIIN